MAYKKLTAVEFFKGISSEAQARRWFWRAKYQGRCNFECSRCLHKRFYELSTRPEVRKCRQCDKHVRLRVGTIFERTRLPMLTLIRALFLVTQDKRGVSPLQLQRQLKMSSYGTACTLLQRIREAMRQRDEGYKLSGVLEFDGADFGEQKDKMKKKVLVAVESKEWVDDKGKAKKRAGFAKVELSRETKIFAQDFVDNHVEGGSLVNTDASNSFGDLKGVDTDNRVMRNLPEALED